MFKRFFVFLSVFLTFTSLFVKGATASSSFTASNITVDLNTNSFSFNYSGYSGNSIRFVALRDSNNFDYTNATVSTTATCVGSTSSSGTCSGVFDQFYGNISCDSTSHLYIDLNDNISGQERADTDYHYSQDINQLVCSSVISLNPAQLWLSKSRHDLGTKFDIKAEIYRDSTIIGSGEVKDVSIGSGSFKNASLVNIPLNTSSRVNLPSGSSFKIKILASNSCNGSLLNSGTVRLWFNNKIANSHFGVVIGTENNNFYLQNNFTLNTFSGEGPRRSISIPLGKKCNSFNSFGTWTITL